MSATPVMSKKTKLQGRAIILAAADKFATQLFNLGIDDFESPEAEKLKASMIQEVNKALADLKIKGAA